MNRVWFVELNVKLKQTWGFVLDRVVFDISAALKRYFENVRGKLNGELQRILFNFYLACLTLDCCVFTKYF